MTNDETTRSLEKRIMELEFALEKIRSLCNNTSLLSKTLYEIHAVAVKHLETK